jgi:DNA-binding transcriptional LysR family regulator
MNFSNMDLNLLRLFDAIYQAHSVSIAALSLDLTQSAASKQLNRLRELLHDPLFVRTHEGMAPTPRAEALASSIRHGLSTIRDAVERQGDFDPRTSERTFRVFLTEVGQMVLFPKVLTLVALEAPGINIETLQTPSSRRRAAGLESGDVDLAVGDFQEFDGSMHCQVLFEEHYSGMVRVNHPTIHGNLSVHQLLQLPHVVYQPPGGGHAAQESYVDNAFRSAGVNRRIAVRLAHAIGMSSIVPQTDCLVIVPHRLALACANLCDVTIVDLPIPIPRFHIAQYWHHRYHSDSGNRWLRNIFEQLFSQREVPTEATSPS